VRCQTGLPFPLPSCRTMTRKPKPIAELVNRLAANRTGREMLLKFCIKNVNGANVTKQIRPVTAAAVFAKKNFNLDFNLFSGFPKSFSTF
jgi:hypothetical protein